MIAAGVVIGSKKFLWPPVRPPHNPTHNGDISDHADQKSDKNGPSESWWKPFVADRVAFATLLLTGVGSAAIPATPAPACRTVVPLEGRARNSSNMPPTSRRVW